MIRVLFASTCIICPRWRTRQSHRFHTCNRYNSPASHMPCIGWAEAPVKIARMTLTIKLDGNWSSFQLANNTPPLSVTGSVIAPSARIIPIHPFIGAHAHSYSSELFPASVFTPTSEHSRSVPRPPHYVLPSDRKWTTQPHCSTKVIPPETRNVLAIRVMGNETTSSWSRFG